MRATIMAARVLAAVLVMWAAVRATLELTRPRIPGPELEFYLPAVSVAIAQAGLAITLLLLADILEELKRRD